MMYLHCRTCITAGTRDKIAVRLNKPDELEVVCDNHVNEPLRVGMFKIEAVVDSLRCEHKHHAKPAQTGTGERVQIGPVGTLNLSPGDDRVPRHIVVTLNAADELPDGNHVLWVRQPGEKSHV